MTAAAGRHTYVGRRSMNQIPLYPLRFDPMYQYRLWGGRRLSGLLSTPLGAAAEPCVLVRIAGCVLVCIAGSGQVEQCNTPYAVGNGDVWLLPAEAGVCTFRPGREITLLEIAIHGC
jgi:hypothetical protein